MVVYDSSGNKSWLNADNLGSVISTTTAAGATTINTYDAYGLPASGNTGRFQYTGQTWLPEIGMYYYKARLYNPAIGRFMQTDPIGYGDGMNWYNYVHGDPVNGADPSGLCDPPGGPCDPNNMPSSMFHYDGEGDDGASHYTATAQDPHYGDRAWAAFGNSYVEDLKYQNSYNSNYASMFPLNDPYEGPHLMEGPPLPTPSLAPADPTAGRSCSSPSTSFLEKFADVADNVSTAASGVALVSGGAALITSETVVGGVGFGVIAGGAELVSLGAGGVSLVANFYAKRWGHVAATGAGMAFGGAIGRTSEKLLLHAGIRLGQNAFTDVVSEGIQSYCHGS